MRRLAALLAVGSMLAPFAGAQAEPHAVTVRNGGADTIRGIQVGPAGRLGENRMRSQLPPGAEARVTYSTGCQADVRLTYTSGQTEDHTGLDLCSDPRIVAGQSGTAGPASAVAPSAAAVPTPVSTSAPARAVAAGTAGGQVGAKPSVPAPQVAKTPVPPWTGRSITRRFGGME